MDAPTELRILTNESTHRPSMDAVNRDSAINFVSANLTPESGTREDREGLETSQTKCNKKISFLIIFFAGHAGEHMLPKSLSLEKFMSIQ